MNHIHHKMLTEILKFLGYDHLNINWVINNIKNKKLNNKFFVHLSPVTDTGKLSFMFRHKFKHCIQTKNIIMLDKLITDEKLLWPECSNNDLTNVELSTLHNMEQKDILTLQQLLKSNITSHIFPTIESVKLAPLADENRVIWLENVYSKYNEIEIIDNQYYGFEQILKFGTDNNLPRDLLFKYTTEIKLYKKYQILII